MLDEALGAVLDEPGLFELSPQIFPTRFWQFLQRINYTTMESATNPGKL